MVRTPRSYALAAALAASILAFGVPAVASSSLEHFELRRSAPAADTVLAASPERIQLWFSQEPRAEGARIRLVDGAGEQIELGATAPVPDTATSLRASVPTTLTAGAYTIHWRAMAADGHVVTGEIPFTVGGDASR